MRALALGFVVGLALAVMLPTPAEAGGITFTTTGQVEILSCASGGSSDAGAGVSTTLAEGTYLFGVTGEDTWLCLSATCASGGRRFPNSTLMLLQVPRGGWTFSCRSSGGTGNVTFTITG